MANPHERHMPKWKVFLNPKGEPGGVEDSEGQLIAKFNPYDSVKFREALAKNILFVQGCVRCDAYPASIRPCRPIKAK
jgi:hypothetical protein